MIDACTTFAGDSSASAASAGALSARTEEARVAPGAPHAQVLALSRSEIPEDTIALARFLLGKLLVRNLDGARAVGRIVETEAYLEADPACHAFRGMTPRNRSLFKEAGHAYVYLCYGTSYLLNVSSERRGTGAGVLLRALEPLAGIDQMRRARTDPPGAYRRLPGADRRPRSASKRDRLIDLARGPGRLTSALQVDLRHDGIDLFADGPLWIGSDGGAVAAIGVSTRIGITKGADAPLRYFVAGSDYLSGSRRLNATSA
ncbi:MAG TPA: DNA-3-methyladenine glycosylase [Steroidobacteraceae bacterium]|nr:DNA-3-methyladenine glycosylase [Steroidobacteraceae bacterium]